MHADAVFSLMNRKDILKYFIAHCLWFDLGLGLVLGFYELK